MICAICTQRSPVLAQGRRGRLRGCSATSPRPWTSEAPKALRSAPQASASAFLLVSNGQRRCARGPSSQLTTVGRQHAHAMSINDLATLPPGGAKWQERQHDHQGEHDFELCGPAAPPNLPDRDQPPNNGCDNGPVAVVSDRCSLRRMFRNGQERFDSSCDREHRDSGAISGRKSR